MSSSDNNDDDNDDIQSFVTHLECSYTGKRYEANVLHNLSDAGKPLLVRVRFRGCEKSVSQGNVYKHDHLPYGAIENCCPSAHTENIVSLGEVMTPLLQCEKLQTTLKMSASILIKDEGRLPTGSFKARGLALAVSMAKELGVARIAMPTNGNAGAALAAYCSQARW